MISSCCQSRALCVSIALAGVALSAYGYYVEMRSEEDPSYTPLCDIDESVSCSVAFNSTYGKGFGFIDKIVGSDHWLYQPNPVYGLFFYSFLALLTLCNVVFLARIQVYLSLLSNFGSLYLAYVLYFVLENLCVVCASIYVVNFLLLVTSACRLSYLKRLSERASQFSAGSSRQAGLPTSVDFKKNI